MNCLRCNKKISTHTQPTEGMHSFCFMEEFGVRQKADFTDLFEEAARPHSTMPDDISLRRFNSSFFQGKYRKYSAILERKNYILKMQQPECPELPAVEFVCNRIGRLLGLKVPEHHLIFFNNQSLTFVSRNFMDDYSSATLDHVYKFFKPEEEFSCEMLCKIIQQQTGKLSEVYRFVELCLFDSLIGNNDRHGRNLGFITRAAGSRTLSPFYDNPSYIGIADEAVLDSDIQPRGAISTAVSSEPVLCDYAAEFRRLHLESAVNRFKKRVTARYQALLEIVQKAHALNVRRRKALLRLIVKRIEELKNA